MGIVPEWIPVHKSPPVGVISVIRLVDEHNRIPRMRDVVGVSLPHRRGNVLEVLGLTEPEAPPPVRIPSQPRGKGVRQVREVVGEERFGHQSEQFGREKRDNHCRGDNKVHGEFKN